MDRSLDSFEPNRLEVLKMLYSQQQATAHKNRERMTQIAAAHISLLLAIDGWILTGNLDLTLQRSGVVIAAVALTLLIAVYAIRARYREFSAVAQMIVRVETALRVFEPGYYLQQAPLYEPAHQDLGKDDYAHSFTIFNSHLFALLANSLLTSGIVIIS